MQRPIVINVVAECVLVSPAELAFAAATRGAVAIQDSDFVAESVRRLVDWVFIPGIVTVGLAMPWAPFVVMLLFDWIVYSVDLFLCDRDCLEKQIAAST